VGPRGFVFSLIIQTGSNMEIENGCLTLLKKFPILNEIRVKNPRTDSTVESLMNFKRDLNLLEKSDKFSKIPS
jgi:hypothetical protein